MGGAGRAFGGTTVAPGVELLGVPLGDGDAGWLDGELVVARVDGSDGGEELLEDELEYVPRLDSLGEDRPQSDLPLEAVLGESLQ